MEPATDMPGLTLRTPEGRPYLFDPGTLCLELLPTGGPGPLADGVEGEVRGYRPYDRIRVTYGSTTVQVAVSASGSGEKAVLRFHQEHLAGAEERVDRREYWRR